MNTARPATNPLEEARLAKGVSLLGLSTRSGIPRNTLRRLLENPHLLSLGQLTALAEALDLDPDAIFAEVRVGK